MNTGTSNFRWKKIYVSIDENSAKEELQLQQMFIINDIEIWRPIPIID